MGNYYRKDKTRKCTKYYDRMVKGCLTEAMDELGLTVDGPTPESYERISVSKLADKLRGIGIPLYHLTDDTKDFEHYRIASVSKCRTETQKQLDGQVKKILSSEAANGLDMAKFEQYRKTSP
ncbi:hypothetical protein VTN00DRAFT_2922 [Thermoascus crustaceus]|uniref:uncharacterized protein n=1 Tax=Thermoascus crustaceus TaxID=5088 RepID=UPI00374429F1